MAHIHSALCAFLGFMCIAHPASSDPHANSRGSLFFQSRSPLVTSAQTQPIVLASVANPSLFSDEPNIGFFAPLPPRRVAPAQGAPSQRITITPTPTHVMTPAQRAMHRGQLAGTAVEQIRYIIGQAESRRDGYDAVQHGATIRPSKPPTSMTLRDIYAWIDATPSQPHAIGRYQFIPKTLKRLVAIKGLSLDTVFTPTVQDALSDILLAEAGLFEFQAGQMPRHTFMNNLAKIWAGLPNSSGKSHYHGFAGNKASITWRAFDAQMKIIQSS